MTNNKMPSLSKTLIRAELSDDTETRFMDAAERQFSSFGYNGTTVRMIASEADANLGALTYYWGSKENLFRATVIRAMASLVKSRAERLKALKKHGFCAEDVLRAFVEPNFECYVDDPQRRTVFSQLYSCLLHDPAPEVKRIVEEIFAETTQEFIGMLRSVLKADNELAFQLKVRCIVGAVDHITTYSARSPILNDGDVNPADLQSGLTNLMAFVLSGLNEPS